MSLPITSLEQNVQQAGNALPNAVVEENHEGQNDINPINHNANAAIQHFEEELEEDDDETITAANQSYAANNYIQAYKLYFNALLLHTQSVNDIDRMMARHPGITGFEGERANDIVQIGLALSGIASCALILGDHQISLRILDENDGRNSLKTAERVITHFQRRIDLQNEIQERNF